MPGEDGYTLIRRVRSALSPEVGGRNSSDCTLPLTRGQKTVLNAINAGFQHHLAKPVEPAELLAILSSLVHRPVT